MPFFHATADLDMQASQALGFWSGLMAHTFRPRDWFLRPDYSEEVTVDEGQ